ncbi:MULTISPECIES: hypothetical protein [unclassified Azospirillum]|uniref:intermembrane phospholipid transport protein YdbH family protein n=1 Tax=unclassified Azospirillum TaxID=2630922 RepID=UPI000B67D7BE|nr:MULTISPECIES: hypothetical protein [unclassified Azospirillum]SNS84554.1 hypothetical protein SAMN05880556_11360 [Azospirillum sp. RU38E]SNT01874.1 hypothetical protein SAMN05880591_11359 [Azospirillum sp. RU37A]
MRAIRQRVMGRMVRQYRLWLAAGLALSGLILFLVGRQMLPGLVERALTQALWAEGLTGAQVTLTELGDDQASGTLLLDTRCAPACHARFTVGYSLPGLWGRRLDALLISDLSLAGWSPPPLPPAGAGRWQWPSIQLRDIPLPLPDNPLLPASAQVMQASLTPLPAGGWQADGQGQLLGGGAVLAHLALQGSLLPGQPPEMAVTASPAGAGPQASGTMRIRLPAGAPAVGEGHVQLEKLALWGLSPLRLEISARSDKDGALALQGLLTLPDAAGPLQAGRLSLSLSGTPTRLEGQVSAEGIGIQDGPRDNRASLPLLLRRGAQGWQVESPAGGALFLPALGVAAHGLTLTVPAAEGALILSADSLHLGGPAPLLVPLRPVLRLDRGQPGQWTASLSATDLAGQPLVRGEAAWQPGGEARLMLEIPPQNLGPAGRSLDALSPWLARWLTAARGRVGLRLTYAQDAAGSTSAAHLLLDQAGFSWNGGQVEGLSGVLWFDTLSPLAMPAQTLWLGRLRAAGMVLDGGALSVELPGDGQLLVGPALVNWSGLALQLAPSRFALGKAPFPLALALTLPDSAAGPVLAALGMAPLSAEGVIAGRIDLPLDGKSLPLGGFQAVGPGQIIWQGAETVPPFLDPQQTDSPALVAAALRHYQFRQLRLSPGADAPVLRLDGGNPDLYGGYAMGLSLHLRPPADAGPPARPPALDAAVAAYLRGG